MRLKAFVIGLCTLVVTLMTALLSMELTKVFEVRAGQIDAIHRAAVIQYAKTLIEAKIYLLSTYREQIDSGNRLSKKYLLSLEGTKFDEVKKEIHAFQKRSGTDFADLIYVTDGRALFYPSLGKEKEMLRLTKQGESGIRLVHVLGKLAVVSFSPLKLYRDPIGMMCFGYFVNGALSRDVFEATKTRVEFFEGKDSFMGGIALPVKADGKSLLSLSLGIEKTAVEGINQQTRHELIVTGSVSLLIVGLLLYLLLELGLLRALKRVFSDVETGARALGRGVVSEPVRRKFPIREVTTLSDAFFRYGESLKGFEARVAQKSRVESIGEFAGSMAHSLKGMVKGLEVLFLAKATAFTDHEKKQINNYFQRMRGLSADTLEKLKLPDSGGADGKGFIQSSEAFSVEMLWTVVDEVVAQKTADFASLEKVFLKLTADPDAFKIFARVQLDGFKSMLSDLIDNAVEAVGTCGEVSISIGEKNGQAILSICDNGCGVPEEVRPRLFGRCYSFGKPAGTGLGLWRARETLNFWGGSISLQSEQGDGTTVEVALPLATPPSYAVSELILSTPSTLIILDDDEAVHAMWKERLREALRTEGSIEFHQFLRAEELLIWKRNQGRPDDGEFLFLCDYEFTNEKWNGLQVIEELEWSKHAILSTWHFEDKTVRKKCEEMGVRLLPKSLAGFIPIVTRKLTKRRLPERGIV